jgi:hypothetical protein
MQIPITFAQLNVNAFTRLAREEVQVRPRCNLKNFGRLPLAIAVALPKKSGLPESCRS